MDLPPDELAEGAVDHLVTGDAAPPFERGRDDSGLEVGLVVGADQDLGAGQAGADHFSDFFRVHGGVGASADAQGADQGRYDATS